MARIVGIGIQNFEQMISNNCFYIDKTMFIKEWWENRDEVTLITRPRRFGKTLTLNMLEQFFSVGNSDAKDLFKNLDIWKEEKYRDLQGTYPVIFVSFAGVKETDFLSAKEKINLLMFQLYRTYFDEIVASELLKADKDAYYMMLQEMQNSRLADVKATFAINFLSELLSKIYGKKVLIFMDEYDTPLQEAYVHGYWNEMVSFMRSMFNNTFKTNPYMERAIMTGITRVSKESIFSDLNNLKVITTTSSQYADSFGFTQEEVFQAMDEMGLTDKEGVKKWYDGFSFGDHTDIYNPWSILNYLDNRKFDVYWANTSQNSLVGKLIQAADMEIKNDFQILLEGGTIKTSLDEEVVFNYLDNNAAAIWGLLLASGYLKVVSIDGVGESAEYILGITNYEVSQMFRKMIKGWFQNREQSQKKFLNALEKGDLEEMNYYLNQLTTSIFSYYDVGSGKSWEQAERFYHGFVLGLIVELAEDYTIRSNRESGLGRYDVLLIPKSGKDGIIIEFKAVREEKEETLESAVDMALVQIENKHYEQELISAGIPSGRIRKYGFAFQGKKVLIG